MVWFHVLEKKTLNKPQHLRLHLYLLKSAQMSLKMKRQNLQQIFKKIFQMMLVEAIYYKINIVYATMESINILLKWQIL